MLDIYYNEIEPFAVEWLQNLMIVGALPEGVIDTRDIRDVHPDDLKGFTQCHFFAGIGVWAYALQQAGWPEDRPVWTGSCPCQPFSSAGRRHGTADERHLWPSWFHHIEVHRPRYIFGEQVASKDGLGWLDLVSSDLEGTDYPIGALDTCAAGFGAPHIRQRQFFAAYDLRRVERMANANGGERGGRTEAHGGHDVHGQDPRRSQGHCGSSSGSNHGGLADTGDTGSQGRSFRRDSTNQISARESGVDGRVADATISGRREGREVEGRQHEEPGGPDQVWPHREPAGGPTNGPWRAADWLFCRDGKWRPVEPGTFPLVDRAPGCVGRLRAYGNAIVAPQATAFVESFMEITDGQALS